MNPPVESAFADPADGAAGRTALFPGDTGTLPAAAREALVTLLKRPYLWAEEHRDQWEALRAHEPELRAFCHNLYLELVVDRHRELAYKAPADADADESLPTLLRQDTWLREDTIVLLVLRRLLQYADTTDGRVVVERDDLLDLAMDAERQDLADRAGARKRYASAVDRLAGNRLLVKLRGSEDRFRISPMVEVLLDKEALDRLAEALSAAAGSRETA